MPKQKRVHFAPTNTVFSPAPTTPSPSLSEASLPSDSSSELSTPPPEIDYSPAHYPRTPFPHSPADLVIVHPHPHHYPHLHHQQQHLYPQHSQPQPQILQDVLLKPISDPSQLQIHYLLAYTPLSDIHIHFDLSLHWSQIYDQVSTHELNEAATNPPMTSLILTTPLLLPWELSVVSRLPGSHVTVMDVLYCLYRHLRFAVTREEYDTATAAITATATATPTARAPTTTATAVDSAYHARCARVTDPHERAKEQAKGVKKVDFLQGRNTFKGLSATLGGGCQVLELNVA